MAESLRRITVNETEYNVHANVATRIAELRAEVAKWKRRYQDLVLILDRRDEAENDLRQRAEEAERVSKRQSMQLAKAAQTIACTEKAIMCAREQGAAEARKPLEDALREAYDSLNPISLVDAPLAKRIRAALAGPEKDAPAEESERINKEIAAQEQSDLDVRIADDHDKPSSRWSI